MNYRDMEHEIFGNGCMIEYEFITNDNRQIRVVTSIDGQQYKMIYVRNEHYVFVIDSIIKL